MANKIFTKIAMSKPMGKVLNTPMAKKVIVPVGKKIISVAKNNTPGKLVSRAIKTESNWGKTRNDYYKKNAPKGAYGK